ncbi:MAG: hypothetical protein K0S44_2661 [Bacteroidetes bacterium]|jgi:hypothetical protein|nr:hypothetical protein [Bacteroidota bacterium]
MKNTITLKTLLLSAGVFASLSVFAQKNKFIEGKKYDVTFYEVKPAGRGKAVPSNFLVKSGKVESDLMYEKIALGPAAYKVVLDSTYTEDETEMHMLKLEAELQEEKNEYKWEVTVINYDIEGTVVQLKSGVEKKKFEFDGTEKAKKK